MGPGLALHIRHGIGRRRWMPVVVTAAVAAALAGAAVLTVDKAACTTPGSYVLAPHGVALVGGCLRSDDLPVPPPPRPQRPPVAHANPLDD